MHDARIKQKTVFFFFFFGSWWLVFVCFVLKCMAFFAVYFPPSPLVPAAALQAPKHNTGQKDALALTHSFLPVTGNKAVGQHLLEPREITKEATLLRVLLLPGCLFLAAQKLQPDKSFCKFSLSCYQQNQMIISKHGLNKLIY